MNAVLEQNIKRHELMVKLVGLRYPAVTMKLIEDEADVPADAVVPLRDMGKHIALCQAFAFARRQGKIIYMRKEDHWCWAPILTYGMIPKELGREGFYKLHEKMGAPKETADAFVDSFPYLPYGKYKGVLIAPLDKTDFEPDLTMIYCKNDQLRVLLMAINHMTHTLLDSSFNPIDSCVYAVLPPILSGNYRITLPDPGEYERGLTPEDDIILSIPAQRVDEFYEGVAFQADHGDRNSFYMTMKEDFERPPIYNVIFEAWGLDTGSDWDKK